MKTTQQLYTIMKDGRKRSLSVLQKLMYTRFNKWYAEQTISARVRDLRKDRHGNHNVERKEYATSSGTKFFKYWIEV